MALKESPDLSEFPPISFEEWKEKAEKDLKGASLDSLTWETEGFSIEPFFTREQVPGKDLATPAQTPYRRGVLPNSNEWWVRNEFSSDDGHGIRRALEKGVQCISLHPAKDHFKGIPEEAFGAERLELLADEDPDIWTEELRSNRDKLPGRGALLYDPLNHLLKNGEWPKGSAEADLDELLGISDRLEKTGLTWHSIPVDGRPFHDAGATLVEELAFTLSAGHEWLVRFLDQGWKIDDLTPRFRFELPSGPLFLPEIAKLRAFRQLWSRIVEAYEPEHACTKAPWISASTSWWSLTQKDPYTNMVRKTTEAMAAVMGGCQQLYVLPFDATGKEPSELGRRVARNTHHLLKEESSLDKVVDPLGGSYYLESLTDRIGEAAWDLVRELEEQGGFFKALEKGSVQARIEASRKERQEALENGERIIVGVNAYRDENASLLPPSLEDAQKAPKGKDIAPLAQERGAQGQE